MDSVQEIKNRLSIVDVVAEYGTLHPAGRPGNYKMLCPFHDDHSPSMIVNEEKGIAWCFSCSSGGDMFSFVQKQEGCGFSEAVRLLAKRAGIETQEFSPEKKKHDDETKGRLFEIMEIASLFFEAQLWENSRAQEILKKRALPEEVLTTFHVGYAPDSPDALTKHLLEKGFTHKEMMSAGLIVADDAHASHTRDKFRNRIMFPICNQHGDVCAFGGRYIGNGSSAPKYLNSPETPIYKKSEILYGFHLAKESMRKEGLVFLVEGYFDLLAFSAMGFSNVVAVSGVAFTPEHAKLLSWNTKSIAFSLDVDEAGQAATRRAVTLSLKHQLDLRIVSIPGGKDPDEARREDESAFRETLASLEPAMDVLIARSFLHRDPNNLEDKKKILDELLPVFGALPREIERDHYFAHISQKIGVSQGVIAEEWRHTSRFSAPPSLKRHAPNITFSPTTLEYLLGLFLALPQYILDESSQFLSELLPEGREKTIYKHLQEQYTPEVSDTLSAFWEKIAEEDAQYYRVLTLFVEEKIRLLSEGLQREELRKMIRKMNNELITRKIRELSGSLRDKPGENPADILSQISDFTKMLNKFHHF
ncbi:DNA primase [Candidatus Peregrinibacteria bacterium]|nr:MAG: DNA primase [Candidatus Peregrinibacteria bacterium]